MTRPMWHDPDESELVRELLQAARTTEAADYDVNAGLARHLAHIEAGVPTPSWAEPLVTPAVGGAPVSVVGLVASLGAVVGAAAIYATVTLGPATEDPPGHPSRAEPAAAEQVEQMDAAGAQAADAPQPRVAADETPRNRDRAGRSASHRSRRPRPDHVRGARRRKPSGRLGGPPAAAGDVLSQLEVGRPRPVGDRTDIHARSDRNGAESREPVPDRPADPATQPEPAPPPVRRDDVLALPAPGGPADPVRHDGRAPSDDGRLELEMRMLKVAHDSLATDPARALRLVKLGDREFAGSMFTQERHYVWIVALARLDRIEEARQRARSYLRAYPSGPYSDRVRRALSRE